MYACDLCNYSNEHKGNYETHIKTIKHQKAISHKTTYSELLSASYELEMTIKNYDGINKINNLISMQTRFLQNYGIDTTLDYSIDHDKIYSNYWSKERNKEINNKYSTNNMSTTCPACKTPTFTTEFIKKFTNDKIINVDLKNKNWRIPVNNINTHINECCAQSFLNVTN